MKEKLAKHLIKNIPSAIKNAVGYIKENFDENGQEILSNTSGTAGLLIKLIGKPFLDKYFEGLTENKLENFGFNTYLKASLEQVNSSIEVIREDLNDDLSPDLVLKVVFNSLEKEIADFSSDELILLFRPIYHPLVYRIRNSIENVIRELSEDPKSPVAFAKHFNENIELSIGFEFGEDYEDHLSEVKQFILEENESKLLWDSVQLAKIGFKENEKLVYQETYAQWLPVSNLIGDDNADSKEESLVLAESLIDSYFDSENNLNKVLFLIADFGKGKSVFLKNYASKLAKQYIKQEAGLFPIYFNLRNFKNYSSEPSLGVLYDYLQTEYGIKIDDEYFSKKKYIFLIDSLDESGELTKRSIEDVITSIKSIQGIDKSKYRDNKIVISSRPFDDGLSVHLKQHHPHIIKNDEGTEIPQFVGIYGFKKDQFNSWISETLRGIKDIESIKQNTLGKKIYQGLDSKNFDLYTELSDSGTLSKSELRRPIFAYMIYQLVIHNVDFIKIGKIGIYLSFLNLLTREAKPYYDKHYQVDLPKELEFRNLLHAIASLWMNARQSGKQGILKKADICRVVEGKIISENDNEVLERNKGEDAIEIQFLSHSYFGENNKVLHFQHQSFAEILLAEYYLKVFIKYSLDEDSVDDARCKLLIGEPTDQTIHFLTEMINLIKEVSSDDNSQIVLEKRKLLFPLIASLATKKNNQFFCQKLHYSWFVHNKIDSYNKEPPKELLKKWPIDKEAINRIVCFAAEVICSKQNIVQSKGESMTSLIKNELTSLTEKPISKSNIEIDKWLALLIGNKLHNKIEDKVFFIKEKKIPGDVLFELIRTRNYTFNQSTPSWASDIFIGISIAKSSFQHINLDGINFSYSNFKYVDFSNSSIRSCDFSFCDFLEVSFQYCDIQITKFDNIKINRSLIAESLGCFDLTFCYIDQGILFPKKLNHLLKGTTNGIVDYRRNVTYLDGEDYINFDENIQRILTPLRGIFGHLTEIGISKEDILSAFVFPKDENGKATEIEKQFRELLDE
jgi:hypothetical protein